MPDPLLGIGLSLAASISLSAIFPLPVEILDQLSGHGPFSSLGSSFARSANVPEGCAEQVSELANEERWTIPPINTDYYLVCSYRSLGGWDYILESTKDVSDPETVTNLTDALRHPLTHGPEGSCPSRTPSTHVIKSFSKGMPTSEFIALIGGCGPTMKISGFSLQPPMELMEAIH